MYIKQINRGTPMIPFLYGVNHNPIIPITINAIAAAIIKTPITLALFVKNIISTF